MIQLIIVVIGQHNSPVTAGCINQNYCNKSVATKIFMILGGYHQSYTPTESSKEHEKGIRMVSYFILLFLII